MWVDEKCMEEEEEEEGELRKGEGGGRRSAESEEKRSKIGEEFVYWVVGWRVLAL